MNPMLVQITNSVVRSLLLVVLGGLAAKGVVEQVEVEGLAAKLTEAAVPLVLAVGVTFYGAWRAKRQQKLLVTAQALPAGVSTLEVIEATKKPSAPSPSLPRDESPKPMARRTTEASDT